MDERTFYLLVCRECGNGDLVMPFGSPAERGKWAAEHTRGTGHDRWLVTDEKRFFSGAGAADVPSVPVTGTLSLVNVLARHFR